MKRHPTRRQAIQRGLMYGMTVPFLGTNMISCGQKEAKSNNETAETNRKMKILILGGTSFLGPHQIAYALSRGHSVSTFTRGKTKPTIYQELFNEVEQLVGDRENNLKSLEEGKWDMVIDNSGRKVEWTKKSAELLKDRAELYLYTSSTGVYFPYFEGDIREGQKLVLETPDPLEDEMLKMEYDYGVMKSNSEIETIKAFGKNRSIIVRPTYMMGPADRTDRFIHWPLRLSRGGEVLVPGKADDPVQYVDVRDVAEWMIRLGEAKMAGTYNAVGPQNAESISEFVNHAKNAFDVESTFIQVDDYEFLKQNDVYYIVPWIMPDKYNYGSARVNNEKAISSGLTFRDVKTSMTDILNWWNGLESDRKMKFEQNEKSVYFREKEILKKWKEVGNG
ncbi:MAG: NAD-dependent epimerase/dehydratase family protein [Bacteroidota bacterium]